MPPPRFLHPFARPSAGPEAFISIVRGDGAVVWDDLGTPYIDALASLWYCQVGHGRHSIAEAIAAQLRTLEVFHTFDRFTNPRADELCERLAATAPMGDARVFLTSGGSESVDTALKLARLAHSVAGEPERTLIVSRTPSYHGVNYGGVSATGLAANRVGFGPLVPDVVSVPWDDLQALDSVLSDRGDQLAAIIAEPIIGVGGVLPPPEGYLAGLRERADRWGGFLILDEVISGFGRLGTTWGAQRYGVQPDLVTFAKGVTSGYAPIGGVLVGPAVGRRLESDPTLVLRHGYTYSGHPTGCAAALANLDLMESERLSDRAPLIGARLSSGLGALIDGRTIVDVRGDGGMWGVELGAGRDAMEVREELLSRGVIARPIGTSVIGFCPPLVITDAQIDQIVEAVGESVA
ncbi:MAG: aminotransferase family protein [Acidimicrobiales bacterium]